MNSFAQSFFDYLNSLDFLTLSIFVSVSAAISVFSDLIKNIFRSYEAKKAMEQSQFEKAIVSDDIKILGDYLYKTLGRVSIHQYSGSVNTADRLEKYLRRINEYLGRDLEIKASEVDANAIEKRPVDVFDYAAIPGSLALAMSDLSRGKIWNGLARMRRDMEIKLSKLDVASSGGKSRMGTVQKIRHYVASEIIPKHVGEDLRQAYIIASRAIHGVDVSQEDAEEAMRRAVSAYNTLKWS